MLDKTSQDLLRGKYVVGLNSDQKFTFLRLCVDI